MRLRISFIPGTDQALQAGRYFCGLANDVVDEVLTPMEPHQYRIETEVGPKTAVRIWSFTPPADDQVLSVMALMHALETDVRTMLTAEEPDALIPTMIGQWLEARSGDLNLFVEKLKPKQAFTERERVSMSVSILGGRLCMVSAHHFMFIEQAPGLFGMAIGSYGSYLFERLANEDPVSVRRVP
jgi:hypothetical protein